MAAADIEAPETAPSLDGRFLGDRGRLLGILLRGYLLLVPTLGIFRFWLITQKRRFYWSHTRLGGEALEYSGTATEILFGFLVAVAIFVPFYLFFLYLGTLTETAALVGSVIALTGLFLLAGFALFRSRRYRLTRTLWRGIRFGQSGSAWKYAFMRLGWYVLTAATLGLAYPFMAASLFRYRYNNTWYGDRRLKFHGSWRQIAGPYYSVWLLLALLIGAVVAASAAENGLAIVGFTTAAAVVGLLAIPYIIARERTRFTSQVTIGDAGVSLRIRARALIGMYVVYVLMLAAVVTGALMIVGFAFYGGLAVYADFGIDFSEVLRVFERASWLTVVALAGLYLGAIAVLSLVAELFIGFTFWKMVVRNLNIDNVETLDSVRAFSAESPAVGEGLADALGSGGY